EASSGKLDPAPPPASLGHRFGKDAAAAAHVENGLASEAAALRCDIAEAQRVDVVQGLELAGRIPPAVGDSAEFGEFGRVRVIDDFSHANDAERLRRMPIQPTERGFYFAGDVCCD